MNRNPIRNGIGLRKYGLHMAVFCTLSGINQASGQEPRTIDFSRDVRPLFKTHCIGCHGPKQQKNGFRLDRRRDALKGGTANQIGPGNSEASRLYLRLVGNQTGLQMPPDRPLSPEQIQVIKAWIDEGAEWPDAASGELPAVPPDPHATRLMELLREGNHAEFRSVLQNNQAAVNGRGPGGATPLMYAALYGAPEAVRLVLEAGADPNARNDAGATALMWAVDDIDKTRLLLGKRADANARSDDGRTPLLIATARPAAYDVVKALLDGGANPSAMVNTYRGPVTPLRLAADAGDASVVRLLLDRGADSTAMGGVLPLLSAMNSGDADYVKLFFPLADQNALKSSAIFLVPPFGAPPVLGDPAMVKKFFDCGADPATKDPAGRTLLMLAATSEHVPLETIKTLVQCGVELNAAAADGRTALDLARQQGHTDVVEWLVEKGARTGKSPGEPTLKPNPAVSIRAAVERSLPLLQRADATFLKRSGCVSCHNNSLTAMTVSAARKAGFAVDEPVAMNQRKETGAYIEVWRERALQNMGIPGDSNTVNYLLAGLAAENHHPDEATDALARYLKNDQMPEGRWRLIGNRPPLESSDFEVAAIAMRSIQVYAPKSQRGEYDKAVWRAANWLRTARPNTTADRAFQLLGLSWAGDDASALEKPARELLSEQRADGGWGQLLTMESDAYATGQAMTALNSSGVVPVSDDAYLRGAEYLRSTQLEDGSWHVRSRAIPFQPYFESGFPHGHDQWISAAATNWATMALIPVTQ